MSAREESAGTGATEAPDPATVTVSVGALRGVRVIDVGNFLAGPYAASIMGEFGAEVLKVEHPIGGDPMRRFGTATTAPRRDAGVAQRRPQQEVGHASTCARREGVELFLKLVAKSDVLIENFRPGTMEEWGLGWEVLQRGQPGPGDAARLRLRPDRPLSPSPGLRAHRTCLRRAVLSRRLSRVRRRWCPAPCRSATTSPASTARSASMVALRHREETGRGQVIDVGIYEAVFRLMDEIAAAYGAVRQGPRTRRRRQLRRRAARPLPHRRRQVGRHRLHHRQDVRAPLGGDGPARSSPRPALRRSAQAPGRARRRSTRSSSSGSGR